MSKILTTVIQNSIKETEEIIHNMENYVVKILQNTGEAQKEAKFFDMSTWNNQAQNLKHIIHLM